MNVQSIEFKVQINTNCRQEKTCLFVFPTFRWLYLIFSTTHRLHAVFDRVCSCMCVGVRNEMHPENSLCCEQQKTNTHMLKG